MSELITLARPYARAVFELARDATGQYDSWSQMLAFMAVVAKDKGMQRALDNPKLSSEQASELFISVCDEQIDEHARNFIRLLAQYGRMSLLPEIRTLYELYRSKAEGIVDAEVVSAQAIDDAKLNAIASALKKRLGRDVKLSSRIDAALLGGAIIHAGDLVIDGSVLGRLNKLSTTLAR